MKRFISADRNQGMLMPYDVRDWLPENHLARFIVDIVDQLNLSHVYSQYGGKGCAAYDPKLLLCLLFYGYSTGVFSSRKIEAATYDSVAFRFIAGNHHPDHDTISHFRKRFLPEIKLWFKEILQIGKELGLVRFGNIYIDGTKVQANASKHKAMSYEYMQQLEHQLELEIQKLLELAQQKDDSEKDIDLDIPEEIQRRQDRLSKIKEAKVIVESRAQERYKKEKEEYDSKMNQRKVKEETTGKKLKGKSPKEPTAEPNKFDQYNYTDPESRIMKTADGFDQCYNGQAAVNEDMIILGSCSNAHGNDKQEFIPTIDAIPAGLGDITNAIADTGYFSQQNINDCKKRKITPIISTAREKHNTFLDKKINNNNEIIENQTVADMNKLLESKDGENIYRKRKQTVEPVFGIIKEIMGFRRFSLRGEKETDAEWSLVCLAYNLKRLFNIKMA